MQISVEYLAGQCIIQPYTVVMVPAQQLNGVEAGDSVFAGWLEAVDVQRQRFCGSGQATKQEQACAGKCIDQTGSHRAAVAHELGDFRKAVRQGQRRGRA